MVVNKVESMKLDDSNTFSAMDIKQRNAFELSSFSNPTSEYRPVVFWSWNEIMEVKEVRRQLRLMKEAGLGGGFIHSRVGLLTKYLGDDWFEAVNLAKSVTVE